MQDEFVTLKFFQVESCFSISYVSSRQSSLLNSSKNFHLNLFHFLSFLHQTLWGKLPSKYWRTNTLGRSLAEPQLKKQISRRPQYWGWLILDMCRERERRRERCYLSRNPSLSWSDRSQILPSKEVGSWLCSMTWRHWNDRKIYNKLYQ